jgi:hypothetical protein
MFLMLTAAAACNRNQQAPVAQSQAATEMQATNQPVTVKGCVRAGDAPDTYVLTGERTDPAHQTATYQLIAMEDVPLADHVGKHVEISGVVLAQQEITTRTHTQPAEKATGTTGSPTVSTSTELDIKKLNVRQIRHLSADCPEEKDR